MFRLDIVWFGEALPEETLLAAMTAARQCDLFLSIGTSAIVYPAAALPDIALESGPPTIEENIELTELSQRATCSVIAPATLAVPTLFDIGKTRTKVMPRFNVHELKSH